MPAPTAPLRSDLVAGVGIIRRDDGTTQLETQDEREFSINLRESLANVMIGGQTIDKRWIQYTAEVQYTPDGRWTDASKAQYWNNQANFLPGKSIFGQPGAPDTDVHLVVTGSDGAVHTLFNTAITGMPSLMLHPENGAIGPVTATAIIGNGKNWTDASAFYEVSGGGSFAYSGSPTWTPSDVLRQQYSANFSGVSGMGDFQAVDGFKVDFRLSVGETKIGGITRDMKFTSLEVVVRCIPAKPTTAQLLASLAVNSANARLTGASHYANAHSLVITGSDGTTSVTIPKCAVVTGAFAFSGEKLRTGEIQFYGCRNYSAGSQVALYTIA